MVNSCSFILFFLPLFHLNGCGILIWRMELMWVFHKYQLLNSIFEFCSVWKVYVSCIAMPALLQYCIAIDAVMVKKLSTKSGSHLHYLIHCRNHLNNRIISNIFAEHRFSKRFKQLKHLSEKRNAIRQHKQRQLSRKDIETGCFVPLKWTMEVDCGQPDKCQHCKSQQ